MRRILLLCLVLLFTLPVQPQQRQSKTVADSVNYMWREIEKDFISLAEAMPQEKWAFKPTGGEFKDARSFAAQVKHVACANEAWAKKLRGETPPERCDLGGPNPAKTKAEIMSYLRHTFALVDAQIEATTLDNALEPVKGPYAGDTRLAVLTAVVWHTSDHYGQLVEYLRMNGIVPPASR